MPTTPSAADDIANAVIGAYDKINTIQFGEVKFVVQDGRLVSVHYSQTERVGKELARSDQAIRRKIG